MPQQTTNPDIVIGGKQFKQPNPPVKPKWDTEPPETDEPTGGAQFHIDNAAPIEKQSWPVPASKNLKGLTGVKRNP